MYDDQQEFESAAFQQNIHYFNQSNIQFKSQQQNIKNTSNSIRKKINEQVQLKFDNLYTKRSSLPNSLKNFNIHQKTQQSTDNRNNSFFNNYDSQNQHKSTLRLYYQGLSNSKLVYQKTRNIGTSWIGRREYFTSLFINPLIIQKHTTKLFGNQELLDLNQKQSCKFDSDFQSGNLFAVYKVGAFQYDLVLQNDINTKGNTQWFYFRISNPPINKNIKINIVNFRKSDSLFNYGMLPAFYSLQNQKKHNIGWIRSGSNVKYYKNSIPIECSRRYYYTLTFTISTSHENDIIRLAQCYPYTYTDINNFLSNLEKINYKKQLFIRQTIYKTLGKNKIQALIIKQSNPKIKKQHRPLIFIISRQHPGQTPGSFIVQGMIQYFLSKQKDSQFLRKNYQIRIIPMANPDGVVEGNYRANLLGFDLNRKWDCSTKQKSKIDHQTLHIKKYITNTSKNRQVAMILDLHGHSRKMFSFFYGNSCPQSPSEVRIFPFICSKLSSMIRFQDSTFNVQQQKRSTARIQLLINQKIINIFTFQASFFGYVNKNRQKKHFTIENYKNLGVILVKSINILEKRKEQSLECKQKMLFDKWNKQLKTNIRLINSGQNINSGSQSCPQECQVLQNQLRMLQEQQSYLKNSPSKLNKSNPKLNKKRLKQDILGKQIQKTLRQMQVLDIARVNSIFPNDFLALVPSKYFQKDKPNLIKKSISTQTQDYPIIKIYESCKRAQTIDLKIQQTCQQYSSTIIQRNKSKSIGDFNYSTVNLSQNDGSNLFQRAITSSNILNLEKNRCFTHQNSRNQSANFTNSNKISSIKSNFKLFSQKQIPKQTKQIKKIHTNRSSQTQIYFQKDKIFSDYNSILQRQPKVKKELQTINPFFTIQPMRKTVNFQNKQFPTRQFRRTVVKSYQIQNWRSKKKSVNN